MIRTRAARSGHNAGRAGRRSGRDRGAAAVEFALVMPLLALILFGIIDFGRLLNTQITLTEAAREGARAAALGADPYPRVRAAADNRPVTVTVTRCPIRPGPADDAKVTVTHQFEFVTPVGAIGSLFGAPGPSGTISRSATGVMPCRG